MRKLDIFQAVSNVSLVAEAGCAEEERKHAETQIARVECRQLSLLALYAAILWRKPFAEKKQRYKTLAEAEGPGKAEMAIIGMNLGSKFLSPLMC